MAIAAYIGCYFLITERVNRDTPPTELRKKSVFEILSTSLSNRSLISIIVASVIMLLSQFTMQQMANYVYPDYYGNTAAQSVSTLAMMVGMLVAASISKPVSSKFGKAEISAAANIVAAVVTLLLFIVRPSNVWVYVVFNLFSWFGLGVFTMVSWALITDVIDDSEVKLGIREDGSIYSLYSFARKLGQAAAAGITGLLLTVIGYERIEGVPITDSVKNGIFNISTLIPAIGFALLGFVLWLWYPLKKNAVNENVRILRARHSAEE